MSRSVAYSILMLVTLTASAAGQGAPMRNFFAPTSQTTKADAHLYLARLLPAIKMRDMTGSEYRWWMEAYIPTSRDSCRAVLKIVRESRENSPTLRAAGYVWSYGIDFSKLVDVRGDQQSIEIRGLMYRDIERYFVDTNGQTERRQQAGDQRQDLSILIASNPYDVVTAFGFLAEKCGGGATFKR